MKSRLSVKYTIQELEVHSRIFFGFSSVSSVVKYLS